ncbi:uncharacterized protein LOC125449501 isoform X5 [Stegostoma tigrinum]|uniref:uncharacterized protein LOC125449501 isoform X5 n=1 Tax=Stegostoma tigrinum TaxID=3053191 RepID=UPI00202B4AA3|nr:uncharacterized protein LOC125449501 isoform X5 [Stegostoma tigrinum]
MNSLYVWLFASMSVSVQGHTASANGWSMTIADYVTAEEGGAAVLPCSFTHPDTNLTLTGSVIWMKHSKGVIFNCTYPGTGHSKGELCENVIQQDGGNRFRFVGNLSNNDASILVDGLGQEDNGSHRCRVELNLDRFGTRKGTKLEVTASQEEVSVVSGTEGESVTLPCIFKTKRNYPLTAVAWMRKEPYQHIITFTAQSQGNWTTGNGGNQYELIGSPEEGNASTRINQLSVRDNHTFLCLVEYSSKPDSQYLIQKETRLLVMPGMTQVCPAFPGLMRPNSRLLQIRTVLASMLRLTTTEQLSLIRVPMPTSCLTVTKKLKMARFSQLLIQKRQT